jgi:multicomponent K+:H+ antiporter subunit G
MIGEWLVSALLLIGAFFTLVGSIGLIRLPDFFSRLHAPTKATTLGLGSMLLGSAAYFAVRGNPGAHELLIVLFLFMTAPVSAHLLSKAALHLGMKAWTSAHRPSPADSPPDEAQR